jgi:hypothetical protein
MITYMFWRVRLWLAGAGERLRYNMQDRQARRLRTDRVGRFDRLVDRLAPWSGSGYRRAALRRWLYRLRQPRLADALHGLALRAIARVVPIERRGRFEACDAATGLQAEWLDAHVEWAQDTTGDVYYGLWLAIFELTPPWARRTEYWLLTTDSQGFIGATQYDRREAAYRDFEAERADYEATFSDEVEQ